jgi:sulfonate transport system substrate-binding protein
LQSVLDGSDRRPLGRRRFLGILGGAALAAGLIACGSSASSEEPQLEASDALPMTVPPGMKLTVTSPQTRLQLELAGLLDTLPFQPGDWPNVTAGPDVINAFRAGSADLASNAGIPPIQAHFQGGIEAKIVAVRLTRVPTYVFATRPGSDIQTVADFRGKRLGFSQGQAQGVVLLRALKQAGLTTKDVALVELNSPQFLTALQAGQVDVAPLGITQVYQYLNQYGKDGAHEVKTDVVDRLTVLWAPGKVLADPAKVAAIAAYTPIWAQGAVWQHEHPDIWVQKYYVEDQGITAEQGRAVVAASSKPLFPPTWDEAIQWEQETIDLLAGGDFVEGFDANILFDRRFEGLTAGAVAAEYQN